MLYPKQGKRPVVSGDELSHATNLHVLQAITRHCGQFSAVPAVGKDAKPHNANMGGWNSHLPSIW